MTPLHNVLQQVRPGATEGDPLSLLVHHLQRSTGRKARELAREIYYAAGLSGHPRQVGREGLFLYHAPRARSVSLSGDFNNWHASAERMTRVGETGLFLHRRPVEPHHRYKFVVDGRWKTDPANPFQEDDGHGGRNSRLAHPGSPSLQVHPDFYSKALRNRRPITVYLPPGYHTSQQRYPTLYVMDGVENLERGRLPQLFDDAIRSGQLPPLVAVFIPHKGRRRGHEYTPFFRNHKQDAYIRFISQELVPQIDVSFRTLRDRQARTLLGQSFGGTIVTSIAVHAPDLFQNVLAQSGVYVWGRRQVLPWFLQTSRTDQRYYLDCVNNRTERQQSEALARVLTARGFAHTYRAIPSRHEYEDWRERVVAGLRFLWFNVPPV